MTWCIEVRPLVAQNEGVVGAPSLPDLQSAYEKARIDASVPFAGELKKLVEGYGTALERLQLTLQIEGALEAVLEVRAELKNLQTNGQPGTTEAKNDRLVKLRGIFSDSKQSIVERQAAAVQEVAATYKTALEALVPELTKIGKLEEALKAKALAATIGAEGPDAENAGRPEMGINSGSGVDGEPGAGDIPIKVTARAERRLTEVPEIEAPLVGADIFAQPDWPLLVMIPEGNYEVDGVAKYKSEKGRMLVLSEGSTFRGGGEKTVWNVANSITTGKSLWFENFIFQGNLGSRIYLEQCSFKDMHMGKGGGWFGGRFMSRWQFRSCAIEGSFIDSWGTRHTGVQMLGCRIERVKFPALEYQNEDEPSEIALNDEMMILDSYFYQCEIPVSVLSLTEDCAFVDCRFVADPTPLIFADRVKRTLKVENCKVEYAELPANLEFKLEELPQR